MDPMEAIKATFFQECSEQLSEIEAGLLSLKDSGHDDEVVNAVFRGVHSIKGGAGAFALDDLVRFAHVFETILDGLRSRRLDLDEELADVLLTASDVLADHVRQAQGGAAVDAASAAVAEAGLARYADGPHGEVDEAPAAPAFVPLKLDIGAPPEARQWTVRFKPAASLYRNANDALVLVRELARLGQADVALDRSGVARLDAWSADQPGLVWTVVLATDASVTEQQLRDVFEFVDGDCDLNVDSADDGGSRDLASPAGVAPSTDDLLARLLTEVAAQPAVTEPIGIPSPAATERAAQPETLVQTTIRVDLERVDRLIDLVGELVINQAMLAQRVVEAGLARSSTIALGLDDLEQLTREIQDSVMAIRAQPVKSVFQRMPRLVREVTAATGKRARLVMEGEGTEVDKTVIERLSDPITHMIRNAIDHGLETPQARLEAGKAEEGSVRLSALHRSGRIIIEVADDGRGIDRERVRKLAVERGVIDSDAALSDEEIDNLIFAPGFSTAEAVSDISGRGVGMDVVKRSIQALGGRISITSWPGLGSTFSLSLPLTLAVLDGMVVSVGSHTLVVPISVIVESLQLKASDVRRMGADGAVLAVRGAHVPIIDVASALGWVDTSADVGLGVIMLVESELGGLIALRVDAIQGQRQVVIKSLEQNYRQVDGLGAATILGDGRVALILDVDGLIAAHRRPAFRPSPNLNEVFA